MHGGQTTSENLLLACLPCNHHKGSECVLLALSDQMPRLNYESLS